jgi:hypothetical protein
MYQITAIIWKYGVNDNTPIENNKESPQSCPLSQVLLNNYIHKSLEVDSKWSNKIF